MEAATIQTPGRAGIRRYLTTATRIEIQLLPDWVQTLVKELGDNCL